MAEKTKYGNISHSFSMSITETTDFGNALFTHQLTICIINNKYKSQLT